MSRLAKRWYTYTAPGNHVYELGIKYEGSNEKPNITGADLYAKNGQYKGFWFASEMPRKLLKSLVAHVKEEGILYAESKRRTR